MGLTADELLALARDELAQLAEEGRAVGELERRLGEIEAMDEAQRARALEEWFRQAAMTEAMPGWAYAEPSELGEILVQRPDGPRKLGPPDWQALSDKMLGAWLGRCAGCMLGKPVEGRSYEQIQAILQAAGESGLEDYFPPLAQPPVDGYPAPDSPLLRGNIRRSERDDDTDYTVLGVLVAERFGLHFQPGDVVAAWLDLLPYHRVYTAERCAYRNMVNGLRPPETARHINPYREWIGAQIRADGWGYICAGWPEKAAQMAFKDACISHTANGIYGEMFFAALIAAAFVQADLRRATEIALAQIPARSRLAEAVQRCLEWTDAEPDWRDVFERIRQHYGRYHPVHTINNACVVLAGLLCSRGDFSRAIGIAVMCGWDTDCNGATAGSVMGAILGAAGIPEKWTAPLSDTLALGLAGMGEVKISDMARRCELLCRRLWQQSGE